MKYLNTMLLLCCCGALAACSGAQQDAGKISLTAQTALDSGNVSYRRGDYKAANEYYRQAARAEPDNVAGWYGVYMAESKLGNKLAADSAQAIVAKMAPALPTGDHANAMQKEQPSGHP